MTSIMLTTYPELVAGGAIIAGLPYGCASNVSQALEAMRAAGGNHSRDLGMKVRAASRHAGSWPTISVWHGTADRTVSATNADAILSQWLSVHALSEEAAQIEIVSGRTVNHKRVERI